MIGLLVDENFDERIVRGLLRLIATADVIRASEVGLRQQMDPVVLEFAAEKRRILLTHDVNTVPAYAYERIAQRKPMPGVLIVPGTLSIGGAIDELRLLIECGCPDDFNNRVVFLPLRS
jgi:Domain of unknown function (DUF5615)